MVEETINIEFDKCFEKGGENKSEKNVGELYDGYLSPDSISLEEVIFEI